jgi:hypothetical protein
MTAPLSIVVALLLVAASGQPPGNAAPQSRSLAAVAEDVGEGAEVAFMVSHAAAPRAPLPVAESDVVLIGVVETERAGLDADGRRVVTRFSVRVESVLKNATPMRIGPCDLVAASREGGRVALESGRTLRYEVEDAELPVAGARYVLLLESVDGRALGILRPFELRDGRVIALDGVARAAMRSALPADEPAFLRLLRGAIVSAER